MTTTSTVNSTRAADNNLDLKFLAIGDSGVGKTCLLTQYVDGEFVNGLGTTVGIDIRNKTIYHKSNKTNKSYTIHLQLWDTAGQERYRSLTTCFFRDAMGFLLVFDITSESSFLNVRNWMGEIHSNAYSNNIRMVLVGNKCDLENERIISKARAQEFAQQYQFEYIETSALRNININESIDSLLDSVVNHYEEHETLPKKNIPLPKIPLDDPNQEFGERRRNTSYCCNY